MKIVGKFILVLIVAVVLLLGFLWSDLRIFRHSLSAFYAKSFCACYYVMRQNEEACHEYSRQYLPIQDFQLLAKEQKVWVKALGVKTTASYLGEKEACLLSPFSHPSSDRNNLK